MTSLAGLRAALLAGVALLGVAIALAVAHDRHHTKVSASSSILVNNRSCA